MKLINTELQRATIAPFESIEQLNANTKAIRDQYAELLITSEKAVLDVIHRFASKHFGVCYLSKSSIADMVGLSRRQVIRICQRFESMGVIAQYATDRKRGGGQTSNTIVFLTQISARAAFVNEAVTGDDTADVTPHVTRLEALKDASLKDINNTKATKARGKLIDGLLVKIPKAIRQAVEPFFSSIDDIYRLVGAIFNGKRAVDKSIRIEDHEQVYYSAFMSVIESYKRAQRKEKPFNVFAVMFKAASDATKSIIDGSTHELKAPIKRITKTRRGRKLKVGVVPDWFQTEKQKQGIESPQPADKSEGYKRLVPDWFYETDEDKARKQAELEAQMQTPEMQARVAALKARLASS